MDGTTDILFCAGPSAEQMRYAEEKGVELVYVPVGLEAFVFFVNEQNPVDNLTVEQIRKIYACDYTNWSEVGGPNRIINPVTRLEGSGSQTAFESVMGGQKIGKKSPLATNAPVHTATRPSFWSQKAPVQERVPRFLWDATGPQDPDES